MRIELFKLATGGEKTYQFLELFLEIGFDSLTWLEVLERAESTRDYREEKTGALVCVVGAFVCVVNGLDLRNGNTFVFDFYKVCFTSSTLSCVADDSTWNCFVFGATWSDLSDCKFNFNLLVSIPIVFIFLSSLSGTLSVTVTLIICAWPSLRMPFAYSN